MIDITVSEIMRVCAKLSDDSIHEILEKFVEIDSLLPIILEYKELYGQESMENDRVHR